MFKVIERRNTRARLWNHRIQEMLIELNDSDVSVVEVDYIAGGYKSLHSCRGSLEYCIKRLGLSLKVSEQKGRLFIRRKKLY